MPFERRILLHGDSPTGTPQLLQSSAIRSCWFDLHRQGGCGAGELTLADTFDQRDEVQVGDWISFEPQAGLRWYLGRVEERIAESPARVRLRLEGMGIELNEVYPGGFGPDADGAAPHRYAATDIFPLDPDRSLETMDVAGSADQVVRLLLQQYVSPATPINYVPEKVEAAELSAPLESLKVRGEESARALIKDLAVRAQGASWGVDAAGDFFFLRRRQPVLLTLREGRDLTRLAETRDRDLLFNRILLTGDYVYDRRDHSDDQARRFSRWRGTFFEPASRAEHGDRRIRIWLPWVRTQADSVAFAKEFFRTYSRPQAKFLAETAPLTTLPVPWLGRVRLENRHGEELITARPETVRIIFDHAPLLRLELGPEDPRALWPEPPHDERWEIPEGGVIAGGDVSFTDFPSGGGSTSNSLADTATTSDPETSGSLGSSDESEGGSGASTSGSEAETSGDELTSDEDGSDDITSGESDTSDLDSDASDESEGSDSGSDDSLSGSSGSSVSGSSSSGSGTSSNESSSEGGGLESDGSDESGSESSSSSSSGGTDEITFVW